MFQKILIANRGEIACRVIRTARKMGIRSLAVYSEADQNARHVREADDAVCIGPAPAAESYLLGHRIIRACKDADAEAVHPGYGFLSENPGFAQQLEEAGITFIGPGTHALEVMGDKIASKKLAAGAGVNTIPGYTGVVPDAQAAVEISNEVGYPVMIKASAGGGGKGMRIARDDEECRHGFDRATSEAESSFADSRVFIERYVDSPRHIEIQIIADNHGNVVALNERECSIQRRHQKIIEEAPSVLVDPAMRKAMSGQAVALARATDYRSAGTVEFIVDEDRNFYFLEMNTRLQVEHPVTEMITGLDLVELMIRVADNEKLPVKQEDVGINGWAMESRIYAENPFREFLPSTGRVTRYRPPEENEFVRVDTGVDEGTTISMFYDPMIAKLVTWGESREQAVSRMRGALDQYFIRGVETNLPFVSAIMAHPRFQSGEITTNFISEEYADGFASVSVPEPLLAPLICALTSIHYRLTSRAATISCQVRGYSRKVESEWCVVMGSEQHETTIHGRDGRWKVEYGGTIHLVQDQWQPIETIYSGTVNGNPVCFQIEKKGYGYEVGVSGSRTAVSVLNRRVARLNSQMPVKVAPDMSRYLLSPMPGLLVSLSVSEGQAVKADQELAVIEAMKMENTLKADQDCVVADILVEPGATLEVDQPILEFERAGGD
ncbi:MAG: acetyl/propionyl/methylcrotonyl-CoA carboxylase subunit alpha [Gammaproteobacteria bacterium]|nr:acetyl/propionyl/methylcrotonyl-CoA carboxylase subunit alpha [Gammaproteobacteria bacterium]